MPARSLRIFRSPTDVFARVPGALQAGARGVCKRSLPMSELDPIASSGIDLEEVAQARRAWADVPAGTLIHAGHRIGDQLDAPAWKVLEDGGTRLVVEATLPTLLQNYRGQLFGGFTGAYVDFIALAAVRQQMNADERQSMGLTTLSMRIEYFEPVTGPRFLLEAEIVKQRGANCFVEVRFRGLDGSLLVAASAALRRLNPPSG